MTGTSGDKKSGLIALVTGAMALVTALVGAGIIHANSTDTTPHNEAAAYTPSPSSPQGTPVSPPASPAFSTTPDTGWKTRAVVLCQETQDALDQRRSQIEAMPWWRAYAFFGQVTETLDNALRELDAPSGPHSRIQQMTQYWDTASGSLLRVGAAGDRGDAQTAKDELMAFNDPNGHGNQIAEDLGLAVCANLQISVSRT